MPPHPLNNFEIQNYYQNESEFNDVYSKSNLPKIKDWIYITNLEEFKSIRIHWKAFSVNGNNEIHFDSFGVEHIPKEIKKFIGNKNIIENIHSIQASNSIMCGYFFIRFIDFMQNDTIFLVYTNLFSPNQYEIVQ